RRHAYPYLVIPGDVLLIDVELAHLVENRNAVNKSLIEQFGDVLGIQRHLEAVAEDVCVFGYPALVYQAPDDGYLVCRLLLEKKKQHVRRVTATRHSREMGSACPRCATGEG